MILSIHKNKALVSSLLLFSGMAIQSAHASSAYSSTATYEYTITATNTNLNSSSLAGLTIGGTIDDFGDIYDPVLDYSPIFVSGSSTHSSSLADFSAFGTPFTQTFHAEDSISAGFASSEYLGTYIQTFLNTSLDQNDIFDITINYSYNLSTSVTGQNADSDINIALSNYDFSLDLADLASASVSGGYNDPAANAGSFNFTLGAGEFDILFVDTAITGTLEAVAPVPVPAAFWLFGTAIMALPGIRKFKAA